MATSVEYRDHSPALIVPLLADKEIFVASESSFYRILKAVNLAAHRSNSRPKTNHKPKPFIATAPNQVWTWDITYLRSSVRGIFYYLYLIVDIYSRKIVGWDVHETECAELATVLIGSALLTEKISGEGLVIHSDNGGPMKGSTLLVMLQWLGIVSSFSRPSVSDDNPFSEALFKTLKYCIAYPSKPFLSLDQAWAWVKEFVRWYNDEHLHSAIKFVTPAARHDGKDVEILAKRKLVYENAKLINPSRWSGNTRNWDPIREVRLNPLVESYGSVISRTEAAIKCEIVSETVRKLPLKPVYFPQSAALTRSPMGEGALPGMIAFAPRFCEKKREWLLGDVIKQSLITEEEWTMATSREIRTHRQSEIIFLIGFCGSAI